MTDESNGSAARWTEFLRWAGVFLADPRYDERERDYKLEAAEAVRRGIDAWRAQAPDWPQQLKSGIQSRHNNLTTWRTHERFVRWVLDHPDQAHRALRVLLDGDRPSGERIDAFVETVDDTTALDSPGSRLGVASLLLFGQDPTSHPFYKPTPVKKAWELTGFDASGTERALGARYDRFVAFCDELIGRAQAAGIPLRDRLDAQSVTWSVARGTPPDGWSIEDKEALVAYRMGDDVARASTVTGSSAPIEIGSEEQLRPDRYGQMRAAWEESSAAVEHRANEAGEDAATWSARLAALTADSFPDLVDALSGEAFFGSAPPLRNFLVSLQRKVETNASAAERIPGLLAVPDSDRTAAAAVESLGELVEVLGAGGPFRSGTVPRVLAAVWALAAPRRYPRYSQWAEDTAQTLGWLDPRRAHPMLGYWELLRALDPDDPSRAEAVLRWAFVHFSGLDATLVARCRANRATGVAFAASGKRYRDQAEADRAKEHAERVLAELKLAGGALKRSLEEAVGRELRTSTPTASYGKGLSFRQEAYVGWEPVDASSVQVRMWVTAEGVGVGLWPKWRSEGDLAPIVSTIVASLPPGLGRFAWRRSGAQVRFEADPSGEPGGGELLGRWFPESVALGRVGFGDDVLGVAAALAPVIDRIASIGEPRPDGVAEDEEELTEATAEIDHLQAAAADLLMERHHLEEIVELLEDKGQVILYGPPGTGKTYVAQRLAEALTEGDPDRWQLVQFHPSTSYEDFFEGFRPVVDDGVMRYELQPGPLARIADAATADPTRRYLLVIDEINRANLPKVFGELLYLLEYRDRPVRALYRPGSDFRLPGNLWFIGTMNTADRSIGLIDAAMRRRFRFVEFFPDREPMAGLLPRWLDEHGEPAWVAGLVDMVNEELSQALSRHLQLGPSFFLRRGLDEAAMAKIWRHSIEPFVEDQFFGDQARIDEFAWKAVWRRYQRLGPVGGVTAGEAGSPSESATAESATADHLADAGGAGGAGGPGSPGVPGVEEPDTAP